MLFFQSTYNVILLSTFSHVPYIGPLYPPSRPQPILHRTLLRVETSNLRSALRFGPILTCRHEPYMREVGVRLEWVTQGFDCDVFQDNEMYSMD